LRFYNIEISDPASGALIRKFSSLDSSGVTMLGALNVELDMPSYPFANPSGNDTLRVWGIPLKENAAASNYNNKLIRVYAGMSKGLPLANPKQQGLILEGIVNQCFGNWQGVDMTLDFIIVYGIGGTELAPKNLVLNWSKGITLGAAVKSTLMVAAQNALGSAGPPVTVVDNTSSALVLSQDEPGFYENMAQFAGFVRTVSRHINPDPKYPGVNIAFRGNTFYLYDGTTIAAPKAIAFQDLVGQPAWLDFQTVQFKTAMRGDFNVSDYVILPKGQVTTQAQSSSQFRSQSAISGVFQLDMIRHVGNFRQPDANSWVTVFNCHLTTPAS
jgi:hypothetical protein